jgi:transglutaminase-like putative cysteine protease
VQQVVKANGAGGALDTSDREWLASIPLYLASCVVTLAGVGAVGVTVSELGWTPVWAILTLVGHVVSFLLRRRRVTPESVFYPVMILGSTVVFQQALVGSALVGLQVSLSAQPPDMATALIIGMLAVIRTFTLVTNASLLFSPVPSITMLALVGASNPNAEVPVFFGLLLLGSLFLTGYESNLRRAAAARQHGAGVTLHLLVAWAFTLLVSGTALLFPMLIQPVMAEFSPFALPSLSRLRMAQNFTQNNPSLAPVGQGPIALSQAPVYQVYTREGGKVRTGVYTRYTGRDWRAEVAPTIADKTADERLPASLSNINPQGITYENYRFTFPAAVPPGARLVRQAFVTQGYGQTGIPSPGQIVELHYPARRIYVTSSGSVNGTGHRLPDNTFEVISSVRDYSPQVLRSAPPIDPATFPETEALTLPNSAQPVKELAEQITRNLPNAYDRIKAITSYIEKNCTYTLQEEVTPPGMDAAAHYLFNSKRGACDLAATATAVMCRSVGIPARVAVGYVLDEHLPSGDGYMVRQAHSHMWVEAFFGNVGWVPFDPAPPIASMHENPMTVAWYRLQGLFSKIGGGGLDAVLVVVVVLTTLAMAAYAGWAWLRTRVLAPLRVRRNLAVTPEGRVALSYERALQVLQRGGWRREAWMTPREFLEALRPQWAAAPEAISALERLTHLFEQSQYAAGAGNDAVQEAAQLIGLLRRQAPRRPRAPRRKASTPALEGTS